MTAPIVVSVILILYYIAYFGFIIRLLNGVLRFVLGVIPLIFAVLTIKVCIERIKEIKKGEEDDISKY
ncbi:MAG: hypothetical protein IKM51_05930 [Oscillospiraceae bacterium]|nr:hypothetical protein [Oscillospiraceae bacterium]